MPASCSVRAAFKPAMPPPMIAIRASLPARLAAAHAEAGSPVHPQSQRDLAAMVDVVLRDVPDDVAPVAPGPFPGSVRARPLKAGREILCCPSPQAGAHVGPRLVQGGADRRGVRLGH